MTPIREEAPVIFLGGNTDIILPSGNKVTIREPNGEDEEMMSRMSDSKDGSNFINYLASIIEKDYALDAKPLPSQIMEWPMADKYYLLFAQRVIHSGSNLNFTHLCQNGDCANEHPEGFPIEQDLNEFDGELGNPDYKPGPNQIKPYPGGGARQIQFTLASGRKLRFKILNSILENKQLAITEAGVTRNLPVSLRELEEEVQGKWVLVTQFRSFSRPEMAAIRKKVLESESTFEPVIHINCPYCKTHNIIHVMGIPAFYYLEEMI